MIQVALPGPPFRQSPRGVGYRAFGHISEPPASSSLVLLPLIPAPPRRAARQRFVMVLGSATGVSVPQKPPVVVAVTQPRYMALAPFSVLLA